MSNLIGHYTVYLNITCWYPTRVKLFSVKIV